MEITKEIKAKVFAQYLGQPFKVILNDKSFSITECNLGTIQLLNPEDVLILKPLSSITDEHMIWVYDTSHNLHQQRKLYPEEIAEKSMSLKDMKKQINNRGAFMTGGWLCNTWNYQYLLSKGYDLENFLLGYKTLHEAGLAIYEK